VKLTTGSKTETDTQRRYLEKWCRSKGQLKRRGIEEQAGPVSQRRLCHVGLQ